VIVCPGVTIGADTVVGAGSVVTRDLGPGVLAVGNPARVLPSLG
jgi:maltose O-acetyltransferase